MRSPQRFDMMHWAKQRSERAELSLGASGVHIPPDGELARVLLGADVVDPFGSKGDSWGEPGLKEAIAAVHGVDADSVLVSAGTSLANYNALAALAGPGDRVLVETPAYAALAEIPRFQGATVERFSRRPERGWEPSLDEIRELAQRGDPVRAVVLTRLHNPSGADVSRAFLEGLAALAERLGFLVLFDEVYLEFAEGATPAHRVSPRFVTTTSLTKVHGFGGLRVGWIVATPEVLAPMKELSFYLAVNGAAWSQEIARRVLERRDLVLARSRGIAARGLAIVERWIAGRDDVSWTRPAAGLCGLVQLARVADTRSFAERLFERESVAVAPGDFFGIPGWIRVSWGIPEDDLREALARLGRALDDA
jgi:aspartate/methionine/tyrosine aminotransferase